MADQRTRREKLEAMAAQTVSPNEAAIAQRLLSEMDAAAGDVPRSARVTAQVDDFLVTVERHGDRVTVHYDGDSSRGAFQAMIHAALEEERRRLIG